MNAIILAGGKSKRFGKDKRLIKLDGKYILEKLENTLSSIFDNVILVTNDELNINISFSKIIKDIKPDIGPLMGIYSALLETDAKYNFITACDMPFINKNLIEYMKQFTSSYDIVCPRVNNRVEPLHSFYSKSCINIIKNELERDKRHIFGIFDKLNTRYVTENEIKPFDMKKQSFFNINYIKDLKEIQ